MSLSRTIGVCLVAVVGLTALGLGGYDSWASFSLELGACLLFILTAHRITSGTSGAERRANRDFARNQRRSLLDALPGLRRLLHRWQPSRFAKPQEDVEILLPADGSLSMPPGPTPTVSRSATPLHSRYARAEGSSSAVRSRGQFFVLGYRVKRHGLGLLILGLTIWQALALVPLPPRFISWLSPRAHALRADSVDILGQVSAWEPWSLAPFLSLQDLWLWIAYVMLFTTAFHVSGSRRALQSMTFGIVLLGLASGGYGIYQWIDELSRFLGQDGLGSLRATGSFGNRNHYALFQSMCFFVSVGWLGGFLSRYQLMSRNERKERSGQALLMALAAVVTLAGLVFSLSRSGLAVTMLAMAGFVAMSWPALQLLDSPGSPAKYTRGMILVPAGFVFASLVLWLGIDPIMDRFQLLPDELSAETGRVQVWQDSIPLIGEFWVTGSGLSTFQYVFPVYRSFGGLRFYSWAHNDYLQLLVELGIPGTLLVVWLGLAIATRARRIRERLLDNPEMLAIHTGFFAAAISAALHSFTDFGLHLPANAALLSIILGALLGVSSKRRKLRERTDAAIPAPAQEPIQL